MGNWLTKELQEKYKELENNIEKLKDDIDDKIDGCDKKIEKIKFDFENDKLDLNENLKKGFADSKNKIKEFGEKLKSLKRDYDAGTESQEKLATDYSELKRNIQTFMEDETTRHKGIIEEIAKHDDQLKTLKSATKANEETLLQVIKEQKEQKVELKTLQRESKSKENAVNECNDLWKMKMEELLHYHKGRDIVFENQRTKIEEEQKRKMEICKIEIESRLRKCEIQTEGLVKASKEATDGLRVIGIFIRNLMHAQETSPQNTRTLLVSQNEDVDASCKGGGRLLTAPRTNANRNVFD